MQADRQEFVTWARDTAVAITTTQPGSGLDDLRPLLPAFAGARIVGLGEATHGTREFFQLKHRLVELLTDDAGFDQFQIEATLPEAMEVDAYVRTGHGDADALLGGMRFWVWDTEEVLALITDLRARGGVRFHGVDVQFAPVAVRRLLELAGEAAAADLEPLLDETLADCWRLLDAAARQRAAKALAGLVAVTDAQARTDEERLQVRRLDGVLRAWLEMAEQPDIWQVRRIRDAAMAEHAVGWLAGGRAALWAHNQHVGRDGFSGRFPSLGQHLATQLGAGYVPVGFSFARGGFQAGGADGRLADQWVGAPLPGSLEEALAEVELPCYALDLRSAPPAAARWLATCPPTRSIGSGFTSDEGCQLRLDPRAQYDVLIHVAETSPARRTASGSRVPMARAEVTSEFVNLDFVDRDPDERPAGWTLADGHVAGRYAARVITIDGAPVAAIGRTSARWQHGKARLEQRVRAKTMIGRRICVSTQARREGHPLDGSVRLLLAASAGEDTVAIAPSAAPSADGSWTSLAAELVVPDGAEILTLGIAVSGNDPVLVRPLHLTID